MRTDIIKVDSKGNGADLAIDDVPKFARYLDLSEKEVLRLQLLAEETLGLVRAVTEDFKAEFWIEGTRGKKATIHLRAKTHMDSGKKRELIAASSSKRNAAAAGFMGKVREIIEDGLYKLDDAGRVPEGTDFMPIVYYEDLGTAEAGRADYVWTLRKYRENVDEKRPKDERAREAWDELEKSIVANIADDVRVAVRGDVVEMEIEKQF